MHKAERADENQQRTLSICFCQKCFQREFTRVIYSLSRRKLQVTSFALINESQGRKIMKMHDPIPRPPPAFLLLTLITRLLKDVNLLRSEVIIPPHVHISDAGLNASASEPLLFHVSCLYSDQRGIRGKRGSSAIRKVCF